MTEAEVVRELAWIDLEAEPPIDEDAQMMTDEEFEEEVAMVAEGNWAGVGLDDLPAGWSPSTIEDLRSE